MKYRRKGRREKEGAGEKFENILYERRTFGVRGREKARK